MNAQRFTRLILLSALAVVGSFSCNGGGGGTKGKPPIIGTVDPSQLDTLLFLNSYQPLPQGGGVLSMEATVTNNASSTVWLVDLDRMPFVNVVDPSNVELRFDVVGIGGWITFFEAPTLIRLDPGEVHSHTFLVDVPFKPSDFVHLPLVTATTATPVQLKWVQAFGDKPFDLDPANSSIYPEFVAWQKFVTSAPLTINGL